MTMRLVTAAAMAAVMIMGTACDRPAPAPAAVAPKAAPATPRYADALAALDARIADAERQCVAYPKSFGQREIAAGLHLQRAQLTSDYGAFARAESWLKEARQLANSDAAVCASHARLHFAVHRLDAAAAALAQCAQRAGLSAGVLDDLDGLAAGIAYFRGQYPQALAGYRAVLARAESVPALTQLSQYHAHTGNDVEALALLDRAEHTYFGDDPQLRAWLILQRAGIYLESGRWEDARAHLMAADRQLSGWWLIEEHLAEVEALLGERDAARARYRAIVERTGLPESLDAWAALERTAGNAQQAQALIERAAPLYRERVARWPEAAAGHALDHYLQFGEPSETLALARANFANRPYGEAGVQLARALLRAGQGAEAVQVIDGVRGSAWDTAELHWVAAEVYAAAGRAKPAAVERQLALARNRRAAVQYRTLPTQY